MIMFRFNSLLPAKLAGCIMLGVMTYAAADSTANNDAPTTPVATLESGLAFAGMTAEIDGHNLSGVTKVVFSGKAPAQFKVLSDERIQVIVPEDAMTGPIQVFTATGEVTTGLVFVVDNGAD